MSDVRPPALNLKFRPGNTITFTITGWDSLVGRTFEAFLGSDELDLSIDGDVMTIVIDDLITDSYPTAITQFVLNEEIDGTMEALLIGRWTPSLEPREVVAASQTFQVSQGAVTLTLQVSSATASIVAHNASLVAHGVDTITPVMRDTFKPMLRGAPDPARWARYVVGLDASAPDSALSFEHGKLVIRVLGGDGLTSERHELWVAPDIPPSRYGIVKSRWASRPASDGIVQHVHVHRLQQEGGMIRAIVLWDGIFGSPSGGIWESDDDGDNFVSQIGPRVDEETVTASSRDSSGLVSVTVGAGAESRWRVGDAVRVDLTDNTYDGSFVLSSVADTELQWTQTNSGTDASGGTGSVVLLGNHFTNFSTMTNAIFSFTDAARTNGIVVSTGVPAGHPLQVGDRIVVDAADNTYDGRFVISDVNQTTNQISWLQPGVADDATAGAGTVTKNTPLWCESQLLPGNILQARFWPDKGIDLNGGTPGPTLGGAPSWEQFGWTLTYDIDQVTGATMPTGDGGFGVGAAHHSSSSPVQFDNIEITPLYASSDA